MILRAHRVADYLRCKQLAFNRYHRGYDHPGDNNTFMGTAVHLGVQRGRADGDWIAGAQAAEDSIRHEFIRTGLPGEEEELDAYVEAVRKSTLKYGDAWAGQQVKVIQAELEFEIPLPNSDHNCVFQHWLDALHGHSHLGPPTDVQIQNHMVIPCLLRDQCVRGCWGPHYFAGSTDSLIEFDGQPWLDEFKTTSITGEKFWNEWFLDMQPTAYLYGVWKATGILPKGFILHGFYKPSQSQVRSWNMKRKDQSLVKQVSDYIQYDRQFYTRSEEDLRRFERDMVDLANEWESRVISGYWPMSNVRGVCNQWNRLCDFHRSCVTHGEEGFGKLSKADPEKIRLYHIGEQKV